MIDEKKFVKARQRLLQEVAADAFRTADWTGREAFSAPVMEALEATPRHLFVKPEHTSAAYANRPQQIGCGQTISQPYIVALMTDLLDLTGDETVLEIGTGSGYQTAVLSRLAERVISLEVIEKLAFRARRTLRQLGRDNVEIRVADGFWGSPDDAPFPAIMVTSAPQQMPQVLLEQLAPGGRMVIPVGPIHGPQILKRLMRTSSGSIKTQDVLPVRFVPMVQMKSDR